MRNTALSGFVFVFALACGGTKSTTDEPSHAGSSGAGNAAAPPGEGGRDGNSGAPGLVTAGAPSAPSLDAAGTAGAGAERGGTGAGGASNEAAGRGGTSEQASTGGAAGAFGGTAGARLGEGGISAGRAGTAGRAGATNAGAAGMVAGAAGSGSVTASAGPPETKPLGYGRNATGGGSKTPVNVASMTELQAAIDAYSGSGGLVLNYTGSFDFGAISDPCAQWQKDAQIVELKQKSDITLVGADGSGANFGLHIASSSSNIIVRDMRFGLLPGGDASDAISIEGMSSGVPTDIWIDHNELWSSLADCAGAGDSSFDGLIDLKKGADRVTISYNYLHDHHNGFSDSDDVVRHVTFHHNVFDNVSSRTPLQRNGFSHLLNNYIGRVATSAVNVRMGGYSLVEGNYFEQVQNAVTSRDSSELGYWELRDNNVKSPADFATFGLTWVASDSTPTKDATDWVTTATFPESLGYTYTADPAACLTKANLLKAAGAGKGLATLVCH